MRAEKSNAERYDTHFSAFDLSAKPVFLSCLPFLTVQASSALQREWLHRLLAGRETQTVFIYL
jgi:hypothetical protein